MEHYESVCRPKFEEISSNLKNISERTHNIETKIYNGFTDSINSTQRRTERIEDRLEDLQKRLTHLILTASGGAIGIIISIWLYL